MNVLYVNANPRNKLSHAAGYATHMLKTIKGLEAAGHRVVKFLAGDTRSADEAKQTYRRMSTFLPRSVSRSLRDVYEVLHDRGLYRKWFPLADKQQFDFVYERMNHLHTCGLRLARRLGIPFVIEINDPLRETVTVDLSHLMKRYAIYLEDRLVERSDFIVVGSEALKQFYVRRGCPPDKLLVLYPTADMDMFRPGPAQNDMKEKYGLQGKLVVGFVAGNISAGWSRPDLLLGALRVIAAKHPQLGALIVGDGKIDEPTCEPGASKTTWSAALTGKVPYSEVPHYINAMDICVIPGATWYGSPTKLFEYGAMGKPLVAPRMPPIQEVIEHGVSGLLFEPENQDDMIRQILNLMESSSQREALGRNLRMRLGSHYTWEMNTKVLIAAVSGCSGHHVRR